MSSDVSQILDRANSTIQMGLDFKTAFDVVISCTDSGGIGNAVVFTKMGVLIPWMGALWMVM